MSDTSEQNVTNATAESRRAEIMALAPSVLEEGLRVPLSVFATELRPKYVTNEKTGKKQLQPGAPDEVWLKLLRIHHGYEKHTVAGWRRLIDSHRGEAAHPSVLGR